MTNKGKTLNPDLFLSKKKKKKLPQNKNKKSPRHDGLRRCRSSRHLQVDGDDVLERERAGGRGALEEEEREGGRESRRFFKDNDDDELSSFSSFRLTLTLPLSAELIDIASKDKKEL